MKHSLLLLILAFSAKLSAQIHCGAVAFEPADPVSLNLQFNSFQEYANGITIYGVTRLKIRVDDKAIPDPDCRWFLQMEVANNPGSGSLANDWETLGTYGTGPANPPEIDILEVRISNICATSPIDGSFASYFTSHGDVQDIISDLLPRTNAGSCALNVNGPGNYMANYNEYTFQVDVRIRPSLDFKPGVYQLNLKFRLEEQG